MGNTFDKYKKLLLRLSVVARFAEEELMFFSTELL
jgi:hypothetical protein